MKNTVQNFRDKNYENIAILCRDLEEAKKISRDLKEKEYIKLIDEEDLIYSGGTVIIPSYFAKGLEFDAVILVQENSSSSNSKLNYVMCTRALHELNVLIIH